MSCPWLDLTIFVKFKSNSFWKNSISTSRIKRANWIHLKNCWIRLSAALVIFFQTFIEHHIKVIRGNALEQFHVTLKFEPMLARRIRRRFVDTPARKTANINIINFHLGFSFFFKFDTLRVEFQYTIFKHMLLTYDDMCNTIFILKLVMIPCMIVFKPIVDIVLSNRSINCVCLENKWCK